MERTNLAPGESLVQCPYNVSHLILNKKQITHLDKCRKQYEKDEAAAGRKPEIVACRFNFSHRIIKPEIKLHEDQCPDQYAIVHSLVQSQFQDLALPVGYKGVKKEVKEEGGDADGSEDWDEEMAGQGTSSGATGGYDPSVKLKEGTYIYMKPGMTKSERNAKREENRKKWLEGKAEKEAAYQRELDEFEWNDDAWK